MNSIKFFLLALNILLVQCATSNVDDFEGAKLLVSKNILNNYLVEGLDISISYNIYNIGNLPALRVKLQDDNFPADKFEHVTGFDNANWAKIAPETNVSHVAVVRPKIVGAFNFTHASVSYLANEKTTHAQIGYSNEIGQFGIQRQKDYNRKFASHTIDWILFIVMAAPSIVFPYFLWYSSKKKYETAKNNRKATN